MGVGQNTMYACMHLQLVIKSINFKDESIIGDGRLQGKPDGKETLAGSLKLTVPERYGWAADWMCTMCTTIAVKSGLLGSKLSRMRKSICCMHCFNVNAPPHKLNIRGEKQEGWQDGRTTM